MEKNVLFDNLDIIREIKEKVKDGIRQLEYDSSNDAKKLKKGYVIILREANSLIYSDYDCENTK